MIEVFPYVWCIHIRNVYGPLVVVPRMNGQVQYIHLVATVNIDGRIVMQTGGVYKARCQRGLVHAPAYRISFADRCIDGVVGLFPYVDMYVVNTVITFHSLLAVSVIAGRADIIQSAPLIRYIVLADVDGVIPDPISRMDIQRQAVDTVASVDVRQLAAVFAGNIQRIVLRLQASVLPPGVLPDIRRIYIRNIGAVISGREARPYLQVERDDAVAAEETRNGLPVYTRLLVVFLALHGGQVGADLYRVTGADRVIYMRLVGAVEIDKEVVDTIQRVESDERVIVMHGVVCQRGSVLLLVTGGPYMREGRVDRFAYIQRVAEDMRLMNREIKHNRTIATVSVRHGVGVFT